MNRYLEAAALFDVLSRRGLFMRTRGYELEVGPAYALNSDLSYKINLCKPELWHTAYIAEKFIERIRRPRITGQKT